MSWKSRCLRLERWLEAASAGERPGLVIEETSSHQGKVKDERAMKVFIAPRATIRLVMEPDHISEATVDNQRLEKMVQPIPHTKVKVGGDVLSE